MDPQMLLVSLPHNRAFERLCFASGNGWPASKPRTFRHFNLETVGFVHVRRPWESPEVARNRANPWCQWRQVHTNSGWNKMQPLMFIKPTWPTPEKTKLMEKFGETIYIIYNYIYICIQLIQSSFYRNTLPSPWQTRQALSATSAFPAQFGEFFFRFNQQKPSPLVHQVTVGITHIHSNT